MSISPLAFAFGAPGMGELLIILVIVLIIFGAGKLPQIGKQMGSAINEFRTSVKPEDTDDNSAPDDAEAAEK